MTTNQINFIEKLEKNGHNDLAETLTVYWKNGERYHLDISYYLVLGAQLFREFNRLTAKI